MKLDDCTKFANENPVCYIATCDGDQPRVRAFMMWYADETGFYFHSGTPKPVCQQLKKNPKIEVCFYAPAPVEEGGGVMMRVAGEAKFLENTGIKARLLQERPFIKQMGVTGPEDPMLAVFQIYKGEAYFWTMASSMQEAEKIMF